MLCALQGAGEGMETRPLRRARGRRPEARWGRHPAATRHGGTRPAAPNTQQGERRGKWATHVVRADIAAREATHTRDTWPPVIRATRWQGGSPGQRQAGSSSAVPGGPTQHARKGVCPTRCQEQHREPPTEPRTGTATRRKAGTPANRRTAPRNASRHTDHPAWGKREDTVVLHSGVHTWSIPHPHSAPHPLPGLRPGAQTHHWRGQ